MNLKYILGSDNMVDPSTVNSRYFFCGSFMIFLSCVCYAFVHFCLYVPCGHLLGKGQPLGSRFWCLALSHFPIGMLGQVWYLIASIPDLCTITYFKYSQPTEIPKRDYVLEIIQLLQKNTHAATIYEIKVFLNYGIILVFSCFYS